MRNRPRPALAAAALLAALLAAPPWARAQTAETAPAAEDAAAETADAGPAAADAALAAEDGFDDDAPLAEIPEEDLLSEEDLDELVAPVALYPDALLAQVFVAATYPLDVIKADRWIEDVEDLSAEERGEAALAEGWDASVVALAAGFPAVIDRMAEELDWTEALGDALLVQPDDVLDAVQRQRARAAALGNLETNEAQTVSVEDDAISIEPTDPQVVYVPAYDSQAVYAQQVAAPPASSFDDSPEVVYVDSGDSNSGYSGGELLLTGALAFGAGMLVNEVFNDDDDWRGYWGPGYRPVYWNDRRFYPRPRYGHGGNRVTRINRNNRVIVNGDVNIDRRNTRRNRKRDSVDRDGSWRPDRDRRDEARRKVAARSDRDGARRPNGNRPNANRPNANRPNANRPNRNNASANRPNRDRPRSQAERNRDQLKGKMQARSKDGSRNVQRKAAGDRAAPPRKSGAKKNAFNGARDGKLHTSKTQKNRGAASKRKANLQKPSAQRPNNQRRNAQRPNTQRPNAQRPNAQRSGGGANRAAKRPNRAAKPKKIKRPAPNRQVKAPKRSAPKRSAIRGGGGHKKAMARGGRHGGKKRR